MRRTSPIWGARSLALVALLGAGPAVSEEPVLVPNLGGPAESVQPPETTVRRSPSPTHTAWPCRFGPITLRIDFDVMEAVIWESSTRREAWHAILALEEDPEIEPLTFAVASEDDGLGDGLVCPE